MKIIDCHVHLDLLNSNINTDLILEQMDINQVEKMILFSPCERVSIDKTRENMEICSRIIKQAPDRFAGLAWINPTIPGSIGLAEKALSEMKFCGLKIIPDHWFAYESRLDPFWERMNDLKAKILFHTGILHLFEDGSRFCRPVYLEKLLHYPQIRFAMAHVSWPWHDECIAVMGRMNAAFDYDNVSYQSYIDITPGAPLPVRKGILKKAIDLCGVDRIMFGSDMFITEPLSDLKRQAIMIKNDMKIMGELGLTEIQKKTIMFETANKFFFE